MESITSVNVSIPSLREGVTDPNLPYIQNTEQMQKNLTYLENALNTGDWNGALANFNNALAYFRQMVPPNCSGPNAFAANETINLMSVSMLNLETDVISLNAPAALTQIANLQTLGNQLLGYLQ